EFRGVHVEFPPGDLLVGHRAAVAAVAGGAVADLAEVAPERGGALQVLLHHGHGANGEVAGDTAADLEEAHALGTGVGGVPIGQEDHVLNTALHDAWLAIADDAVRGEDVAHGAVLPARAYDGQVALGRGHHPAVLGVYLVVFLQRPRVDHFIEQLVRKAALAIGLAILPQFHGLFL